MLTGITDIPPGLAALAGALIGSLAGAAGQYLTEKMRQRGQRDHQNRLLLQETYVKAIRVMSDAGTYATNLALKGMARDPDADDDEEGGQRRLQVHLIETAVEEGTPLMVQLLDLRASIQAVGSHPVRQGVNQVLSWMMEAMSAAGKTAEGQPRSDKAMRLIGEWTEWTVREIRRDLQVKDSRARHRYPDKYPEIKQPDTDPLPD